MTKVLAIALSFVCYSALANQGAANIRIVMQPAVSQADKESRALIKRSKVNQHFSQLVDQLFNFRQAVTLEYGINDGPLYDPNAHGIYIPYAFVDETLHFFSSNNYQKQYGVSAEEAAIDTLLHTLLHELGHAYITDQKIPILGKEEDAADNLATIVLLNYVELGDEVAISAADMFAFESEDKPKFYELSEYINEHSFDLQRYFSTLCLVYGSNPKRYPKLLNEIDTNYLAERQEFCIQQYQQTNQSWHTYLKQP
ncbi:DUF4344 domain-containing metallopeptidase [Agarivorans sp. Alg241-V36]|uniref:DUF4344 domain-containing metallopeptidase n=1 Tax=Agarivorans sp. Alg241-V36 TaxID=2305992 RepID=UPI001F082B4B|nr:DUF4344 domain-containing metallopeptidase [Agarivorans sp. Alg241-V36]